MTMSKEKTQEDQPQIIVVVGSQRSGTNLVCNSVGNLPNVVSLSEIFQVHFGNKKQIGAVDKWRKPLLEDLFGMDRFPFYIKAPIRSWPKMAGPAACTKLFKAIASGKYMSDISQFMFKDTKYIICKILFQQCPTNFDTWDVIAKTDNVKIVYLKRHNFLDIVVSSANAYAQKQWYVQNETGSNPKFGSVIIKPDYVLDFFTFIEHQYSYFDVWLPKTQKSYKITYKSLCDDWANTIKGLCDFVGIETPDDIQPAARKQILVPHKTLIQNFDELQEYFRGTKWESYFEADE
jgi:LPS sulfotransferase NodH